MDDKKEVRPKVSPKEYREFIKGVELMGIIVKASQARRLADIIDLARPVDLNTNERAEFKMRDSSTCIVQHHYELSMTYTGEKDRLLEVECTFEVGLRVASPMTKDYSDIFARVNLPVNTWPYFREFVHSTISRMGLPPVVLPLVKRG
jgi:preprotein translocase subunit SecB